MQVYAANYYDIQSDWIPSSNFANRPVNEIWDLHLGTEGLWTFMDSEGSSDEEDYRPADSPQSPRPQQTPLVASPVATTRERPYRRPQQLRRCSSDATVTVSPATAPLDGYFPADAPQPPRRALSARLDRSGFGKKSRSYRKSISERLRKPGSGLGAVDQEPQRLQLIRPQNAPGLEVATSVSFSQKPRVKKVLQAREMGKLKTDGVCFESKTHPDSATSMMRTPRELYCSWPRQQVRDADFDGVSGARSGSWKSISPKAAWESVPTGDGDDPHIWGRANSVRDGLAPGQRRFYVPGPIVLEAHSPLLRRDSVAPMDAFVDVGPQQRRTSDTAALDEIAGFFDEPGVSELSTEEGLDKFWLKEADEQVQQRKQEQGQEPPEQQQAPTLSPTTPASIMELTAHLPWAPLSCNECQSMGNGRAVSRFSFSSSSASSAASVAPSRRQRLKLRRLLLPALPGSTFLKGA